MDDVTGVNSGGMYRVSGGNSGHALARLSDAGAVGHSTHVHPPRARLLDNHLQHVLQVRGLVTLPEKASSEQCKV